MLYALVNNATGRFMADQYRSETVHPHEAMLYSTENGARRSITFRKGVAAKFNGKNRTTPTFPDDFAIVPCRVVPV